MVARRKASSKKKSFNLVNRRLWLFIISLVLVGLMVWQVFLTLGVSSRATFNRQGACKPQHGRGQGWGGFTLCKVDKTTCADSCTCVPFRNKFKYGRCVPNGEVTPTPTAIPPTPTQSPPGMLTCGETCDIDSQCASGYCHDPEWQACPTETPEPTYTPEPTRPHKPTNTPYPTRIPKPTHVCGVRGSSLVVPVKVCRDRTCFNGEQCACPIPATPTLTPQPTDTVVCAADAKLCDDGSYVSRQGPHCEFAPCPGQ